jgi:hypothetical protein
LASFVIGAVGMHQYDQYRAGSRAADTAAPGTSEPAPSTPGAADTEVTVPPVAAEPDPASAPEEKSAGARGRLTIRSVPTGALVTIDGRPVGRTPVTVNDLSLDAHAVVVARPGYESVTRRATLSSRATSATVSVTLSALRPPASARAATTGSVAVDSRPRGARITIDGRAVGQTPASVPGLSPGRHSVRLDLSGYKPLVTSVIVKAGETARIAVSLEEGK